MNTDSEEKKLLRKRYKEKLKGMRNPSNNNSIARSMKADPASTLLNMGIEDPNILMNAKSIISNPKQFLGAVKQEQDAPKVQESMNEHEEEEDLPPDTL